MRVSFVGGPFDGASTLSPTPRIIAELCLGEHPPRSHYVHDSLGTYIYRSQCNEDCPGGLGWKDWKKES